LTLLEAAVDRFGGIDVLVNNAGLGRGSDVESLSTDDYETMQETNVDGVFYATRAAIPHVREREGAPDLRRQFRREAPAAVQSSVRCDEVVGPGLRQEPRGPDRVTTTSGSRSSTRGGPL